MIESDIDTFNKLKNGTFNGMIDMYEMREDSPTTDNGTPMNIFLMFLLIINQNGVYEYLLNHLYSKKHFNR